MSRCRPEVLPDPVGPAPGPTTSLAVFCMLASWQAFLGPFRRLFRLLRPKIAEFQRCQARFPWSSRSSSLSRCSSTCQKPSPTPRSRLGGPKVHYLHLIYAHFRRSYYIQVHVKQPQKLVSQAWLLRNCRRHKYDVILYTAYNQITICHIQYAYICI